MSTRCDRHYNAIKVICILFRGESHTMFNATREQWSLSLMKQFRRERRIFFYPNVEYLEGLAIVEGDLDLTKTKNHNGTEN